MPLPEPIAEHVRHLDPAAQAVVAMVWHMHEEQRDHRDREDPRHGRRDPSKREETLHIDSRGDEHCDKRERSEDRRASEKDLLERDRAVRRLESL